MTLRLVTCLFLIAGLAACDPRQAPDAPPEPAPEVPVDQPAEPQPAPESAPEPAPQPVATTKLARPKPQRQEVAASPAPAEFDLQLPQELLEVVEPGEPLTLEPLLPALFGRHSESDIRLNGRLIESPTPDRMFDGAELKIEIRR